MTQDVSNLSAVAVLGPRTDFATLANLSAVAVLGPPVEPEGIPRLDILPLVAHLGVVSISETGTTTQRVADNPEELTTGERTVVTQITAQWSSSPTAEQLAAFSRTIIGSPAYEVTHV